MAAGQHFEVTVPSDMKEGLKLNNGQMMPIVGLGTFLAEEGKVTEAVYHAIKTGYRHIDCASIYGNETAVGAGIARAVKEGIVQRSDLWVTSKLWIGDTAPANVAPALQRTLDDLGLEYLDLYLIHWPFFLKDGTREVPPPKEDIEGYSPDKFAATWAAMEKQQDSGKARSVGVSNMTISKLQSLLTKARIPPAVNQVEVHPSLQQEELVQWCMQQGIAVTAYSPLGNPSLRGSDGPSPMQAEAVSKIAEAHGKTAAQVLLRWNMQRGVIVIPKSTNPGRIEENWGVLDWSLTQEDMTALQGLDEGRRLIDGMFFAKEGETVEQLWE